jgi:hypothetical protein
MNLLRTNLRGSEWVEFFAKILWPLVDYFPCIDSDSSSILKSLFLGRDLGDLKLPCCALKLQCADADHASATRRSWAQSSSGALRTQCFLQLAGLLFPHPDCSTRLCTARLAKRQGFLTSLVGNQSARSGRRRRLPRAFSLLPIFGVNYSLYRFLGLSRPQV